MRLPGLARCDWSILIMDVDDETVLAERDPRRVLRTASVGKVFLLIEAARQLETGERDPGEPVTWTDEERVEDSGLWYLLDRRTLGLADLCVLVGAVSDNLATNALLRTLGLPAVHATTAALGYVDSALLDRVRTERWPADPPTLSRGNAAELADVMARLHRGTVVDVEVSTRVRRWLAANTDLSMVASAFDLDPLAHADPDRGITMINKTGTISTARIDVGVVEGPVRTVAWAVLAEWDPDHDHRDQVLDDMRTIGRQIRAEITGSPSD